MDKTINGRRYNTSTAKVLAAWHNDCPPLCVGYVSRRLYRKKTGEYFMLTGCFKQWQKNSAVYFDFEILPLEPDEVYHLAKQCWPAVYQQLEEARCSK